MRFNLFQEKKKKKKRVAMLTSSAVQTLAESLLPTQYYVKEFHQTYLGMSRNFIFILVNGPCFFFSHADPLGGRG
jgi:hypothetical protein